MTQVIRLISDRMNEDGEMIIRFLALETPDVWDDSAKWNAEVVDALKDKMFEVHGVDLGKTKITETVEAVYGMMGVTAVAEAWGVR